MRFFNYIESLSTHFVDLTQTYSDEISLAFVATLLVLFGDKINSFVRRRVIKWFFLVRIFIFVLLCAIGYGVITVTIHPLVHVGFLRIPRDYSFVVVVISFIILGILAERKKLYESNQYLSF